MAIGLECLNLQVNMEKTASTYEHVDSRIELACKLFMIFTDKKIWHAFECACRTDHDDVIKWKQAPRHWPSVRGIHQSPENSPHKRQWLGALMFSMIYAWTNSWANHRDTGDLRRNLAHYQLTVMQISVADQIAIKDNFLKFKPCHSLPGFCWDVW